MKCCGIVVGKNNLYIIFAIILGLRRHMLQVACLNVKYAQYNNNNITILLRYTRSGSRFAWKSQVEAGSIADIMNGFYYIILLVKSSTLYYDVAILYLLVRNQNIIIYSNFRNIICSITIANKIGTYYLYKI